MQKTYELLSAVLSAALDDVHWNRTRRSDYLAFDRCEVLCSYLHSDLDTIHSQWVGFLPDEKFFVVAHPRELSLDQHAAHTFRAISVVPRRTLDLVPGNLELAPFVVVLLALYPAINFHKSIQ